METRRTNHTGTGVDTELTSYSITGKPLARVRTHWTANQGMITERNYYAYDALDRPAEHPPQGAPPTSWCWPRNTYDELGRLAKTVKPAETVTYGYDLQGRVTDIDGKFSQSLQYDYVGNIKAMRWSRKGFQGYSSVTWDYTYDALDRLTEARAKAWPAMQVAGRQRKGLLGIHLRGLRPQREPDGGTAEAVPERQRNPADGHLRREGDVLQRKPAEGHRPERHARQAHGRD